MNQYRISCAANVRSMISLDDIQARRRPGNSDTRSDELEGQPERPPIREGESGAYQPQISCAL